MLRLMAQAIHIFLLVPMLGIVVKTADGWSESGHHLIALLAFDELTPSEQRSLLAILAAHPRYSEDFTPPEKVRNADRFRVGTAGYWPDIARGQPLYNRPTWHYQLGASLTLGDPALLNIPESPGPLPAEATLATQELYIAQAVSLCRRTMREEHASPADRAIAVSWLAHLVGDAHQPCHAASLYAARIFPEGDRGANSIPTKQKNNLHALWDGLLGGNYNEGAVARRLQDIQDDPLCQASVEAAKTQTATLDSLTWLAESRAASKEYVYTREILSPVEGVMREAGELPVLYLSETYLERAGKLAQLRAAAAGYRLAGVWRDCLD